MGNQAEATAQTGIYAAEHTADWDKKLSEHIAGRGCRHSVLLMVIESGKSFLKCNVCDQRWRRPGEHQSLSSLPATPQRRNEPA